MLKEHRSKISDADARQIESALEEARKAIADGGVERINQATDRLTQASHKLAEAMYKASSQPGAGPHDGSQPSAQAEQKQAKDNVVDAEFVDMDDKK
jgi:molecular chaperone DnaK